MPKGRGRHFPALAISAVLIAANTTVIAQDMVAARSIDAESAARHLAGEILGPQSTRQRLPLTSDVEHARTIDPVLTEGAAIWIHEALPSPPLTVLGGRVFSYSDMIYDPLDAPVLKIRAIDDDQVIPFLIRVVVKAQNKTPQDSAVRVSFPAPPIFSPRLEHVEGWIGPDPTMVSIERSSENSLITVRIPLVPAEVESLKHLEEPTTVIIEGALHIGSYEELPPGRFAGLDGFPLDPELEGLATLELARDIAAVSERERLHEIAEDLPSRATTDYERVVAVNSWVSTHLRYQESPATRSPLEALQDRSGDCDDYTALAAALLRSLEIPARRPTGLLYDFDTFATHAWVEVALPLRGGGLHWFIVDPTLAGTTAVEGRKKAYVQFRDRVLLYPLRPVVNVEGMTGRPTTDILLNWRKTKERPFAGPREADGFIDLVIEGVDREISRGAEQLAEEGLLLRRKSASIAGSPYLAIDRQVVEESSSRLQLRLENEERLVLDLVAEKGSALESKPDLETIHRMRAAYTDLNDLFFGGMQAHHNLELIFSRDHHSDHLHTVRLRFGRYLVEHYLDHILKRLSMGGLLTEEETGRISAVAKASGGENLYVLQELARQLPKSAEGAKDE